MTDAADEREPGADGAGPGLRPLSLKVDGAVALGLALVVVLLVGLTIPHYGLTYDEGWYLSGSARAREWLGMLLASPARALSDEGLRTYWAASRTMPSGVVIHEQQPGAAKLVDGVIGYGVGRLLGIVPAERAGTALFLGACVAALYLLVASVWGRTAGAFAALALMSMPRVFAHAHLAALDVPVMSTGLVCIAVVFAAVVRKSVPLAAAGGLLWGVALSCKINAVFIPLILGTWILVFHRAFALRAALCLAIGGPVGFMLSWPWLWRDTFARLGEYFAFHTQHYRVAVSYFGRVSGEQPWHYPLVMTGITTPVLVLLLAGVGAVVAVRHLRSRVADDTQPLRRWRQSQAALLLLGAVLNIAFNSLPSAPKYTGVRLFLPFFPFVAALAGIGVRAIGLWLSRRAGSLAGTSLTPMRIRALVAGVLLLPSVHSTGMAHPFQLSYYNLLIGGIRGAVSRGMEATYWGDTYQPAVLAFLHEIRPGDVVWIDLPGCEWMVRPFLPATQPPVELRSDDRLPAEASWAIVQNKASELDAQSRALMAAGPPIHAVTLDGVPLALVYDHAGVRRARVLLGDTK